MTTDVQTLTLTDIVRDDGWPRLLQKWNKWQDRVYGLKQQKAADDRERLATLVDLHKPGKPTEKALAIQQSIYGAGIRNQWPPHVDADNPIEAMDDGLHQGMPDAGIKESLSAIWVCSQVSDWLQI